MSSLTLMRDAEWPKTLTSTLLSNFNSLVMSLSVLLPTRSSLTLITLLRSSSGLSNLMRMLITVLLLNVVNLLYKVLGAQPFNYSDAVDALPNAIHSFGGADAIAGTTGSFIDSNGLFNDAGAVDVTSQNWWHTNPAAGSGNNYDAPNLGGPTIENSGVSDAGTFVLAETALDMHCWGENPVVTAKLQLNGQDRFSEREGTYFDLVQPYQHHTRNPDTGINVYSFALRPEEHQPSGSCNFSRIDNATLQLVLSNATVEGTKTAKVRVYATNYNVLRVMSGMGGLAYSN